MTTTSTDGCQLQGAAGCFMMTGTFVFDSADNASQSVFGTGAIEQVPGGQVCEFEVTDTRVGS
jgi:hypothetical protein